jgi:hypothetical protein
MRIALDIEDEDIERSRGRCITSTSTCGPLLYSVSILDPRYGNNFFDANILDRTGGPDLPV